jgi:hypothetical protein
MNSAHFHLKGDLTYVSLIPKGYNSLPSQLATAYDRTNHSQPVPVYSKTHYYDAVQSDAPTREPPHTQSGFAAASPLANENTNLPCIRMNPNGSLTRVPERNEEKPQRG